MRAKRKSYDEQLQLIMECRESGLSDYQWCKINHINPGTFYNWIGRLRKLGTELPATSETGKLPASKQEVVKVDLVHDDINLTSVIEQNTSISQTPANTNHPAVEIALSNATIRFFNDTQPQLIETIFKSLGGIMHVR